MTTITEQTTTGQAPQPGRTSSAGRGVLLMLVALSVILLIGMVVLVVKVAALQDKVAALSAQTGSVVTVSGDPDSSANQLATCRLLGALAARSHLTLTTLFPDATVGACEAAADEGYHQALRSS